MDRFKGWMTFRPWQRHSLVLMVGGLVYILLGTLFLATNPETISDRQQESLYLALRMLSLESWGTLFIGAGVLACLSSRWPEFSDSWGYMVLTGTASGWGAMYLFGYILGAAPSSNLGYAGVWFLMAFLWWAISGLMNPEKVAQVIDKVVTDGSD